MREPVMTTENNHLPLGPGEVLELGGRGALPNTHDLWIGGFFLMLAFFGFGSAIIFALLLVARG